MALKFMHREYITEHVTLRNKGADQEFIRWLHDELGPGNQAWTWHMIVTVRNKITRIINDKSWH